MSQTPPHEAIRNVLARYCIALDTKDWALLNQVFTPDIEASYPLPGGELVGLEPLRNKIKSRLTPVDTHHTLGTQYIQVHQPSSASTPTSANVTTYFTGTHFGTGKWAGQHVTAYGKYEDSLELIYGESGEELGGVWRITKRTTSFMGRLGEEGVMGGG